MTTSKASFSFASTLGAIRDRVLAESWSQQRGAVMAEINSRQVVEFFGSECSVTKIDRESIQRFTRSLAQAGNRPATINRKLAALSKMLTYAHEQGHIAVKPKIARQRGRGGRLRFLTLEEEARVLGTTQGVPRDAVMFLLDTGARCGEALKLRWQDVVNGRVTFWDTKNDQPRTVPLTARVRAMLDAARAMRSRPFPIRYHQLHDAWERCRTALGFANDPQFVLHMLRHTCASRLVQRGADTRRVQAWLGHSNITQTMKYAHLAPDSLDSMTALLEASSPTLREVAGRG